MKAVIFTRPNCMPCKATKRHLSRLRASWEERPLNDELAAQFRSGGFSQAPIVEVYDIEYGTLVEVFTGYDPDKIDLYFKDN